MEVESCCQINLKFDADLTKEQNILTLPNSVEESVNKIIKKEGYKTCDVYKRAISTDGGNYLGTLYEIDIKGKTNDNIKETNLFIKSILQSEKIDQVMSLAAVYEKETFLYTELGRIYNEMQDEANVPPEERYKIIKSYEACNSEAIILENIAKKGYKTCNRKEVIPLKFTELAIQQLAKFHGLSFVLEKKRPEYFNTVIKKMKMPFQCNDDWKSYLRRNFENLAEDLDSELKRRINNFYPTAIKKFPEYLTDTTDISCLCHGDFRGNNILMKEINNEIADVIVVDYQLMFYGCPLLDFWYLIFTATDKEFRKNNLTNLKNLYYESLTSFLKYFDMDIEDTFPRKDYERLYKKKFDFGIMMTMQIFPFIFADDDEIPDLESTPLAEVVVKTTPEMLERLKGNIEDCIEWGCL